MGYHAMYARALVSFKRKRLGCVPAICCGMVGSRRGWIDAGYVRAPCGLHDLKGGIKWVKGNNSKQSTDHRRVGVCAGVSWESEHTVDANSNQKVRGRNRSLFRAAEVMRGILPSGPG